jgi:chaperonin GroEL
MKEKKARVEDALHATRAAVEEGLVPGGGVALVRCLEGLDAVRSRAKGADEKTGVQIVRAAIQVPLKQIAANAGKDGAVVLKKVLDGKAALGYNAETDTFEDLVKAGVVDPTKVVRTALQNAASVAALLLTTDCLVAEKPEEKKPAPGGPEGMGGMGGGMGGMGGGMGGMGGMM